MLHEEIMKFVPENLKESVRSTYIDEFGYLIYLTDDYVVNTSGINLQYVMFKMSPEVSIPYYFNHVYKIEEAPEQEREEEEEEEEPEELDQPTDVDQTDVDQTDVDQTDEPQLDMNNYGYVLDFEVSIYLPCKSTKEYTDKCIEFNTRDLSGLYSAFYDAAILSGSTLGYDLTKSSIDISYSTTFIPQI